MINYNGITSDVQDHKLYIANLTSYICKNEIERNAIKLVAKEIQQKAQVLLVIGVGGSFLGARCNRQVVFYT